jgi:4-hydroxy-3-methylbut-2-enyl diphosphate reductase
MVDRVLLAEPRGFCAGVEMAIKALTWMVRVFEPPVYCYHQIVHNKWVVEAFERAGVVFVDQIDEVPVGAPVMLSAHGSSPQVVSGAKDRAGVVVDAVCPLVTKVHHEVRRMSEQGYEIIYIGHEGHDEAVGTMAEAPHAMTLVDPEVGLGSFDPGDPSRVALLAQTTLGVHEWRSVMDHAAERFPDLWTARRGDLCYATTNRQEAVLELARRCDLILVVGSETSSNTLALVRVADEQSVAAHRVDNAAQIDESWLDGVGTVGVTAGASAPDHLVAEVVERLAPIKGVELLHVTGEDEYFPLPPALRSMISTVQALVEAGYTARRPGEHGLLERDRTWGATEALDVVSSK